MSAKFDLFRKKIKHTAILVTIFSALVMSNNTSATIINFDDLNPVYDEIYPCWCDNPLSDQYLSKGLRIWGAWVNGENSHNNMLTSNWTSLEFVGELPTFFSMNINSVHDDAVSISIYGPNGLISDEHTSGWSGPDEEYIPVIPNEFFSFSTTEGISSILIQGYYGLRTGAEIDNLNFTYSSVPEPSPIVLLSLGLFALLFGQRRKNRNIQ
jgi:hypothetical protein